jgi:hypothetical protein
MPPIITIKNTIKADINSQVEIYFWEDVAIYGIITLLEHWKSYNIDDVRFRKINIFNNFFIWSWKLILCLLFKHHQ